jgi:hypothetical protein
MKSIFIVLGVTGENEDQRSWLVKAFPSEREALAYIEKLEATYQSFDDEEGSEDQLIQSMKELDENFEFDHETGTEYSITECPFESSAKPINRSDENRRPTGKRPRK